MDILRDILETILGQNEERTNQDVPSTETELTLDDDESTIEREIIKCQSKHGKLLIQTGKALRKRYQDKSHDGRLLTNYVNQPVSEKVDRTIRRLAKRRYRGNCPVKAEQKALTKTPKAIIDHYFEKQKETIGL